MQLVAYVSESGRAKDIPSDFCALQSTRFFEPSVFTRVAGDGLMALSVVIAPHVHIVRTFATSHPVSPIKAPPACTGFLATSPATVDMLFMPPSVLFAVIMFM